MFFFSQLLLFVVSIFLIVTYSLNIGALSEADILVNPKPAVQAELIMSSIVLAIAAFALIGIFVEIPLLSTLLTRQAFVYLFSFLLIATYSLNLYLLDSNKATGLKNVEVELSGAVLGVALLVAIVMTYEVVRHYRKGGTFEDLMAPSGRKPWTVHNPLFTSDPGEGGPNVGRAAATPMDLLKQIESD